MHSTGIMFDTAIPIQQNNLLTIEPVVSAPALISVEEDGHSGSWLHHVSDHNASLESDGNPGIGGRIAIESALAERHVALFANRQSVVEMGEVSHAHSGEALIRQDILGLDANYELGRATFLAEYFRLFVKMKDKALYKSNAFYAQIGYKFLPGWEVVTRYTALNRKEDDPYYQLLNLANQDHLTIALRYEMDDANVIKFEHQQATEYAGEKIVSTRLQWSFYIP